MNYCVMPYRIHHLEYLHKLDVLILPDLVLSGPSVPGLLSLLLLPAVLGHVPFLVAIITLCLRAVKFAGTFKVPFASPSGL